MFKRVVFLGPISGGAERISEVDSCDPLLLVRRYVAAPGLLMRATHENYAVVAVVVKVKL